MPTEEQRRRATDPAITILGERVIALEKGMRENTELTKKIEENTKGIVDAWQAIVGGLQVLAFLAKLAKWGAALATFGGIVWYFVKTGELPKDIHPK